PGGTLRGREGVAFRDTAPTEVAQAPPAAIDQTGATRIEVNVVDHGAQIVSPNDAAARAARLVFHGNGLVAPSEKVPPQVAPGVETPGVGVLEPLHPGDEIWLRRAKDRMVVVVHQHPRENLPAGAAAGFGESLKEECAVPVVPNDGFPTVSPCHDVVDGVLVFDAGGSGHEQWIMRWSRDVKCHVMLPDP